MSPSISLRLARHLSTTTAAAAATTTPTITISKAKSKLKSSHHPDTALKIYSTISPHYTSPLSSRYPQEYTVKRLARSHRYSDIETFLESHKTNKTQTTHEHYISSIIRSYGVAGSYGPAEQMFEKALATYNQMDELAAPRTVASFNCLLSACVKCKLYDRVPHLFDEMSNRYKDMFSPDNVSHGILIRSVCETGKPELALEMMKERGIESEATTVTYTQIINALYKKGKKDEAERMWGLMVERGCVPDVGAYNVKMMSLQGGEPEGVKAVIEEMVEAGLKPDTISYNYLMTCYCRNGMMDEAERVYEELETNGCNPNSSSFRTLVFYLCRNERYEKGVRVFRESVKANKIPDFNTMKYLVRGLVKSEKVKEAKGIVGTIKKKFPPNVVKAWSKLEAELGLDKADDDRSGVQSGDEASAA